MYRLTIDTSNHLVHYVCEDRRQVRSRPLMEFVLAFSFGAEKSSRETHTHDGALLLQHRLSNFELRSISTYNHSHYSSSCTHTHARIRISILTGNSPEIWRKRWQKEKKWLWFHNIDWKLNKAQLDLVRILRSAALVFARFGSHRSVRACVALPDIFFFRLSMCILWS